MLLGITLIPRATLAETNRIEVTVVDIAGATIYLAPGADAGVRVGQKITLMRHELRVVGVSREHATVTLAGRRVKIGMRGSASVQVVSSHGRKPPTPQALSAYQGLWKAPTVPAGSQKPKPIPISSFRLRVRNEVTFSATANSIVPLGEDGTAVTRLSLRGQMRFEPYEDTPFGIDADVEAGGWFGAGLSRDLGSGSRPALEVQELRLRYGDRNRPGLGLGRLRYAAALVGLLDGVRVESPTSHGVSVYAFGGVVPDSLTGKPTAELSRFGVGAMYSDSTLAFRPTLEATTYGSYFEGSMDERRVTVEGRVFPGPLSLAAFAELSIFDSDNAWGAGRFELTSAGLETRYSYKQFTTALGLNTQQPERSRWLASLLPPSWLCTGVPGDGSGAGDEPCDGGDNRRTFALANTTYRLGRLSLGGGASATIESGSSVEQTAGFVDVVADVLPFRSSLDLGAAYFSAPFVDSIAGRVGVAVPISPLDIDTSVYYRPAILSYEAATENLIEHHLGTEISAPLSSQLNARVVSQLVVTDEVSYLAAFTSLVWRPRLQ